MKLKRLPDDFRVEELADFPVEAGPFALYVLEKRSLGTLEAIEAIVRAWNLTRDRIGYGGLKDKHAVSRQFVTIEHGPTRDLGQTNFKLNYLGQASQAFSTRHIAGNRFQIVLRDLSQPQIQTAERLLPSAIRDGLPNYFDDQRFGSLGESGEFMAAPWCRGDYERAVWLALADANPRDRSREREEKRLLREHWGNLGACREAFAHSPHQRIVNYLAHNPRNYRTAITYIRQDLRSLYLAAFQSFVWNQILAAWLRQQLRAERLSQVEIGGVMLPFFDSFDSGSREASESGFLTNFATSKQIAELSSIELPLPSARLHLDEGPLKSLMDEVVAKQGLELREMRVKYPRDSFFSKGDRAALFFPRNLAHEALDDDLYPGRKKLCLAFDLPRGSYATILVKRITEGSFSPEIEPIESDG